MAMLGNALVALVALLHAYFLVLEMFLWTKPQGLAAFNNTLEKAKEMEVLAANQGLYNGFLAAGLVFGIFYPAAGPALHIKTFFLVCVFVAGAYGAYSTGAMKILAIQALPAFIALLVLWMARPQTA
jgi:putative membrane protein